MCHKSQLTTIYIAHTQVTKNRRIQHLLQQFELPADDSFLRLEAQCSQVGPRICVNDEPLDMTINKTLIEDIANSKCHMSLPDLLHSTAKPPKHAVDGVISTKPSTPTVNMKDVCTDLRNVSLYDLSDANNGTKTTLSDCVSDISAYFSGRSSSLTWKSNSESIMTGTADSIAMVGRFFDNDSDSSSAYQSGQSSSINLRDSLHMCRYRRSDQAASYYSPPSKSTNNISFATSSPIQLNGSNSTSAIYDSEPDEFNDTLERVNYMLSRCSSKPMSPSKWERRKRLLRDYARELMRQEPNSKLKDSLSCNDLSAPIKTNMAESSGIKTSNSNESFISAASHHSTPYNPLDLSTIGSELKAIHCAKPLRYRDLRRKNLAKELAMGRNPSRKTLKRSISVEQFV